MLSNLIKHKVFTLLKVQYQTCWNIGEIALWAI